MLRRAMILLGSVLGCLGAWTSGVAGSETKIVPAAVVCAGDASFAERLAAGEIRRYVYLRTGRLLSVVDRLETASGGLIVVGSKSNKLVRTVLEPRPGDNDRSAVSVQDLEPEQYLLADSLWKDRPILVVAGGQCRGQSTGRTGRAASSPIPGHGTRSGGTTPSSTTWPRCDLGCEAPGTSSGSTTG